MTVTLFRLKRRSNLYRKSKTNPKGTTYDLRNIVTNIKWKTDLNFSAGELTFDLIEKPRYLVPYTGDIISFRWDKKKIFYGYVWKYEAKADGKVSVTCYDKMRYLKNQDSIVWQTGTIADRFTNCCKRAGIKYKVVDKPKHKVAAEVCDGKTYFDMIKSAITKTYEATGHMYYLYANYDVVELRRAPAKKLSIEVAPKSGMTDYTYSVDIDDTANVVKVIQKDEKKSQTTTATAGDDPKNTSFTSASAKGKSIAQWGKLQITENKKDKANYAQMLAQAKAVLKEKNAANKELKIECIGDTSLTAGNAVTVKVTDIKRTFKNCPILKATHTFGNDYTCELEMKAGEKWLENNSTT